MLDPHNFTYAFGGRLFGEGIGLCPEDDGGCLCARLRSKDVRCRHGFPTDAADAAASIFNHYVYAAHKTRTSNFSFSTRVAAASLAEPEMIWVDFCFCGSVIFSRIAVGAFSCPSSAAFTLRSSLVLAFLMPMRVA